MRATSSTDRAPPIPNTNQPMALPIRLATSTGFRPMRSDRAPRIGPAISEEAAYTPPSTPDQSAIAPGSPT